MEGSGLSVIQWSIEKAGPVVAFAASMIAITNTDRIPRGICANMNMIQPRLLPADENANAGVEPL
jgi:hypothetical protein